MQSNFLGGTKMELSKVTIDDLYELANNTLTGGWTIKSGTHRDIL